MVLAYEYPYNQRTDGRLNIYISPRNKIRTGTGRYMYGNIRITFPSIFILSDTYISGHKGMNMIRTFASTCISRSHRHRLFRRRPRRYRCGIISRQIAPVKFLLGTAVTTYRYPVRFGLKWAKRLCAVNEYHSVRK